MSDLSNDGTAAVTGRDNDGFYDPALEDNTAPTIDADAPDTFTDADPPTTDGPLPNPADEAGAPATPYPADTPEQTPAPAPTTPTRQPLADEVRKVLEDYATGELVLGDGKRLTPSAIAKVIGERRGGKAPSAGAVHAYLNRLVEVGYITLTTDKPIAFADYTEAARTVGLAALITHRRAQLAQARHDAKAAKAAAEGGVKHADAGQQGSLPVDGAAPDTSADAPVVADD